MRMSPTLLAWESLAPGALLAVYLLVGAAVYAWRAAHQGRPHDAETAARGETLLLGMALRQFFTWLMRPLVAALVRWSIPATALTSLSVLLSCMAAIEVAAGHFGLGGWLYLLGGACDFLDGRVARSSGSASKAGAALDSIVDRYVESFLMLGLMWHYRQGWVLIPASLALVGSLLVPYVRARGEGLGVSFPNVGFMQRPERVATLGLSLVISPLVEAVWPTPRVLASHATVVLILCLLALSTQLTAIQRLRHVLGQLRGDNPARLLGRASVGRTVITASVATLIDFIVVTSLVETVLSAPVLATLLGAGVGALCNFSLNRYWTFKHDGACVEQATRYTFVSGSSALLNALGVAALLLLPALDYRIAWCVARATVFLLWNYPLQRDYVFGPVEGAPSSPDVFSAAHDTAPGTRHARS
jgi:phosphatidylglycerophosphate synthase/putative flippase GtrA